MFRIVLLGVGLMVGGMAVLAGCWWSPRIARLTQGEWNYVRGPFGPDLMDHLQGTTGSMLALALLAIAGAASWVARRRPAMLARPADDLVFVHAVDAAASTGNRMAACSWCLALCVWSLGWLHDLEASFAFSGTRAVSSNLHHVITALAWDVPRRAVGTLLLLASAWLVRRDLRVASPHIRWLLLAAVVSTTDCIVLTVTILAVASNT